jgi:hypothetical protein
MHLLVVLNETFACSSICIAKSVSCCSSFQIWVSFRTPAFKQDSLRIHWIGTCMPPRACSRLICLVCFRILDALRRWIIKLTPTPSTDDTFRRTKAKPDKRMSYEEFTKWRIDVALHWVY